MHIIAADDERLALQVLIHAINEAMPTATVHSFSIGKEALAFARENCVDIAFLDIDLYDIQGVELARQLKEIHPKVNIVFVTGYPQYAVDAYVLYASGYLLKPVTAEKIAGELSHLRYPVPAIAHDRPMVQCFGNFEVFMEGEPVQFLRTKSKEILAYLVDRRGAGCTAAELAAVLWEDGIYDRSRQKQLSVIRLDLIKSLQLAGIEDILVRRHDALAINPDAIDCDYYRVLKGDRLAANSFLGEYMSHYSWAEYTTALLNMRYMETDSGTPATCQTPIGGETK